MPSATSETVGRIYAGALFQLARERGAVGAVFDALMALRDLYDDPAQPVFREAFTLPWDRAHKHAMLDDLFGSQGAQPLPELLLNLLHVLVNKGREAALDNIAASFERYRDEAENRMHAGVTSAEPLTDDQRERLRATMAAATGKTMILDESVNPDLLGGMIIRLGDRLVDSSVRTRLKNLNRHLFAHEEYILG